MTFDLLLLTAPLLVLLALALTLLVRRLRVARARRRAAPPPEAVPAGDQPGDEAGDQTAAPLEPPRPRAARRWPVYVAAGVAILSLPATLALFWPAARVCWKGCGWEERYEQLTRNGELVSADLKPLGTLRRPAIVQASELPPAVVAAFVVTEDARFGDRRLGVDLRGTGRSLLHDLVARPVRSALGRQSPLNGGSTIDMQTVRLLPGDPFGLDERSLRTKLNEMLLAVDMRLHLTREQILTLYFNLLPGPDGTAGIESLAERAFGCRAQDLSLAMAATLAGANRSPVRLSPRVSPPDAYAERTRVLRQVAERRPELQGEVRKAEDAPIGPRCRSIVRPAGDPWVMYALRQRVAAPESVRQVRTTIESELQRSAQAAVDSMVRSVERGRFGPFRALRDDPLQAAMVVLRPDGAVAAAVCGRRDRLVPRAYDRCGSGRFECGSVCKTFSFAAGVEYNVFDENTPTDALRQGPGVYCDTSSWGSALERIDAPRLSDVLRLSSNYGGCLMYRQLPDDAFARINAIGIRFRPDRPANSIGGGVYPSLLELTAAFASLESGIYRVPAYLPGDPAARRPTSVWSPATVEHVRTALEPVARDGTAAGSVAPLLEERDSLISKTGTSSESESLVYC
ncbi:MAG TPA: transglycosylase domain-containing protein, partial [Longimicrobiales bacterium]